MAFTEQQLEKLKQAYASGVRSIRIGDKLIEYQTLTEMAQAINQIEKSLGRQSSRPRRIYPVYTKDCD